MVSGNLNAERKKRVKSEVSGNAVLRSTFYNCHQRNKYCLVLQSIQNFTEPPHWRRQVKRLRFIHAQRFRFSVNLHRYFKTTLSLINVSVLNFVNAFCLNIRAGFVIGRSLCKHKLNRQILANVGNLWKTAEPLALRFNLFINVNMKYDHVGMNRDDHLFLYNPKNPINCI